MSIFACRGYAGVPCIACRQPIRVYQDAEAAWTQLHVVWEYPCWFLSENGIYLAVPGLLIIKSQTWNKQAIN